MHVLGGLVGVGVSKVGMRVSSRVAGAGSPASRAAPANTTSN